MISRRRVLGLAATAPFLASLRFAFAEAATDHRFVFVIQRGAADGLNIVIPYADPAYARLRGAIAIDPADAKRLDGTFALHAGLEQIGRMYEDKQALFVHAVASRYRDRSHFDGQNVLETGGASPYQLKNGWLNRLAGLLPAEKEKAIAFSPTIPMALRGPAPAASYAPSALPDAPDDLLSRVTTLYENDAQLGALWREALKARDLAGKGFTRQNPAQLGKLAATFLAQADGPRIAMIETGGWDTHSGQNANLTRQLKSLDALVAALRDGLGPHWARTTVLIATEFGRTAAVNGTLGTDHGQASAAMLLGGSVKGGRVVADWPGLAKANLYEGRDLKPTTSLEGLIAGAAAEGLGLEPEKTAKALFGQAGKVEAVTGLLRV